MKTKKLLLIFISAVLVFSFCGCEVLEKFFDMSFSEDEEPTKPLESPEIVEPVDPNWPVTAFGTEIEKAPEKVAVISPALAEYIFDMELSEKIVAIPEFCAFEKADSKPKIGSVRLPDMEAIKEAAPEYILTFAEFEESILIELQQMNITVINIEAPKNLDELRALYKEIALFFNGAIDGVPFGDSYVSKYDSELSSLAYSGEQKTFALLLGVNYDTVLTGDTMINEILSAAGIKNIAEGYTGYLFPEENWKEFDPEVIFLRPELHLIDLETSDLYKKKTAVKGDKVYNVDMDAVAVGSLRSFEILKDVLATVYEDYTGGTPYEPAYPSMYKQ
ncbi:MAG: ABC transporter substrate-binding protein [Oscillospiraceae bacterium]|nr:ABC transporter substrate-binding protein [Oscillospiraceae bacterium]